MHPFGRAAIALAALAARLFPARRRNPEEQARLERAAAAIDRELAADLELVTMYMQTKQPAVLENAAYGEWRDAIASVADDVGARLDVLYGRIPDAEDAMERRGPAGSIRPEDRATVQQWEGNARVLQRRLRALPATPPPSLGDRLVAWVRARLETRSPAE